MGHVGGLVPRYLVEHLSAKLYAQIHSYDKPYVLCKDGLISHDPSTYKFYYSRRGDLIIMTGDEQPTDSSTLYTLCDAVLDLAQETGKIKRVYTTGGYKRERQVGDPRVYGVANMPRLFKELDKLGIREIGPEISSITWFNGIILGIALKRNIEAVGLYGEIDDPAVPQEKAARSVLKAIVALLSLPQIRARRDSYDDV